MWKIKLSSLFIASNYLSSLKLIIHSQTSNVSHSLIYLAHEYFQSEEASRDIEQFVAAQAREDARRQLTGGCRTVHSRTVINTRAGEEEERRRASEETKLLGNTAFRQGQFSRAEELYTSALLQYDKVTLTHPPLSTFYTLLSSELHFVHKSCPS